MIKTEYPTCNKWMNCYFVILLCSSRCFCTITCKVVYCLKDRGQRQFSGGRRRSSIIIPLLGSLDKSQVALLHNIARRKRVEPKLHRGPKPELWRKQQNVSQKSCDRGFHVPWPILKHIFCEGTSNISSQRHADCFIYPFSVPLSAGLDKEK